MENKELDKMCTNCEKGLAYKRIRCPFRSISNEYCDEYEKIKKKLEVLELLKKYYKSDGWSNGGVIEFWKMSNTELKEIKECLKNENK